MNVVHVHYIHQHYQMVQFHQMIVNVILVIMELLQLILDVYHVHSGNTMFALKSLTSFIIHVLLLCSCYVIIYGFDECNVILIWVLGVEIEHGNHGLVMLIHVSYVHYYQAHHQMVRFPLIIVRALLVHLVKQITMVCHILNVLHAIKHTLIYNNMMI